jgi:hypothetical protein
LHRLPAGVEPKIFAYCNDIVSGYGTVKTHPNTGSVVSVLYPNKYKERPQYSLPAEGGVEAKEFFKWK